MNTMNELNKWLKKPGNNITLLAGMLGYKTPLTIKFWLNANRIPEFQEGRVLEIITKKEEKEEDGITSNKHSNKKN